MPKNIFIDTSIYIQKNFNFDHDTFDSLLNLSKGDHIQLHSTYITNSETHSNIEKLITESKQYVSNLRNKGRIFRHTSPFHLAFERKAADMALTEIKEKYDGFVSHMGVEYLPINNVDVDTIFKNYFNSTPPFSEKKKSEFPDAFVLESIKNWCTDNDEEMYIISTDGDMKDFCDPIENLFYLDSLEAFLDVVSKDDRILYNHVLDLYSDHNQEIEEAITEGLLSHFYDTDDLYGEVDNINFDEIEIQTPLLVPKIGVNTAKISFDVSVGYDAEIFILDESNSFYDNEDKTWLHTEYKKVDRTGILNLPVEIEICDIDFKKVNTENFTLGSVEINNNQTIYISTDLDEY